MSARGTHLEDQGRAAAAEAAALVRRAATLPGCAAGERAPTPWVAQQVTSALVGLGARRARRCRHLRGDAPAVVLAFAWRPGRFYCPRCARAEARRVQGTAEDRRCDVCGGEADVLHPDLVAVSSLLFVYGACRGCLARTRGVAA